MVDKIQKNGFTLIEIIVVLAIFGIVTSAVFGSIANSRQTWDKARSQMDRQAEARRALDRIAWELKESCPSWKINSTFFNLSINTAGDRMDLYLPMLDSNNKVSSLYAVRYYIGGINNSQLLRKVGANVEVLANYIDNAQEFKPLFDYSNPPLNTMVDIAIPVRKDNTTFVLQSRANLRNRSEILESEVIVEEISEQ